MRLFIYRDQSNNTIPMLLTTIHTNSLRQIYNLLQEHPVKTVRPIIEEIEYALQNYTWEDEQEEEQRKPIGFQTYNEIQTEINDDDDELTD